MCCQLKQKGIEVSLFIDPDSNKCEPPKNLGVEAIELHTGTYADATTKSATAAEFQRVLEASRFANECGLILNMGHGLTYRNVQPIAQIEGVHELNIGHSHHEPFDDGWNGTSCSRDEGLD